MRIDFESKKLAAICADDRALRKQFGADGQRQIRKRLDDLEAAPNAMFLRKLPGRFEEKKADLQGSMAVHVHGGHRIIFRPAAHPPPRKPDGGLDLLAVDAVIIEDIRDYH